jgi:superfamily II DNA or RNA helicase
VEIVQGKVLKMRVRDHERITKVIPKSKYLGEVQPGVHEVAVHFGLDEAQILKNLRLKGVRSPIAVQYDWPGKYRPFDHQRTTAEFLTLNKRCFCFSEQGCVDSETEYLSPTGWVKISDYAGGAVAQYHPSTRGFEFVAPEAYVKLPCGSMVRVKTKYGVDQLLSPEHRVLLHDAKQPHKHVVMAAADVLRAHDGYHAGQRNIDTRPKKLGTDTIAFSSMSVPSALRGCGGTGIALTDAELRVQVAVIADGHFPSGTARCVVRLKKERKKLRLRELLRAAGVEWHEREQNTATAQGFTVFSFYAPLRTKKFGPEFWAATMEQLGVISDEVLYWDSCITRGVRFSTSVEASADFVQYAFVSTGRTARVSEAVRVRRGKVDTEYVVQVRDTQNLCLRSSDVSVTPSASTDGFKYCFTVPSTFLVFRRNGCVFASGNTGKTSSVIWAADYLLRANKLSRVLVVCPVSIMQSAWVADIFKTAMRLRVGVAHGSREQRRKVINGEYDVVIINYDGIPIVEDDIKGKFDLIVLDEANYVKTATTKRWKALHRLVLPDTWLWLLTGTPAAQSPLDAYGLARLVSPTRVPKFFGQWRDKVMVKINMYKWVPSPRATAQVNAALQPAIRFTKKECLDLPDETYQTRTIPLTPQQAKYYKEFKTKMLVRAAGEPITAVHAAAMLNKLLQLSLGAVYSDSGDVIHFDGSNRTSALLEVVEEASNKVIVFVPYRHAIELVTAALEKEGHTVGIIDGSVPLARRTALFKAFQETPDPHVLVIQPQAAAHGVTLTAADTVVWFGPVSSVETYLQGNARVHRAGQTNKVTVVRLCGSAAEEKVYKSLETKGGAQESLMALYEDVIKGE